MKCKKYTTTPLPKAKKSLLPIKKRMLRGNFHLASNEPLPKTKPSFHHCPHQTRKSPLNKTVGSPTTATTLDAVTQDLKKLMFSGMKKANRKIHFLETKNNWRTKLGLSKVAFSNGVWLLARNKANAAFQSKKHIIIPTSPIVVKSQRELVDNHGLMMLADATSSVVNSPASPTSPEDTRNGVLVNGPNFQPVVERQKSWSRVFPTGILSLGPTYGFWG